MVFRIITKCPKCGYVVEAEGNSLSCFELTTMEGCVIECDSCDHVFLYGVQALA